MTQSLQYYQQFFSYFPQVYVCAMSESGILKGGIIDNKNFEKEIEDYQKINATGAGIFFTPNAIKDEREKHKISNLAGINAWYLDIDIEETKHCQSETDFKKREDRKAEIRGAIWSLPNTNTPSITIENRNGFHLYWLYLEGSESVFPRIENGIFERFKLQGADPSSTKIVQLLRVPGFKNAKNGEAFEISIDQDLSRKYPDGSYYGYTEREMLDAFPYTKPEEESVSVFRPPKLSNRVYTGTNQDIFDKVHLLPVEMVLSRISGHSFVNGEHFELQRTGRGNYNIIVDGKPTGNFIDTSKNHIYGPRDSIGNGPTITQWLRYYGREMSELAQVYRQLFSNLT